MVQQVSVILDDRLPPPPEVVAIIGATPFRKILRRRLRLGEEISAVVGQAGKRLHVIDTDESALALARRIEDHGPGIAYVRLPAYIAPMRMDLLGPILTKAAYSMETMLLSTLYRDDAAAILHAEDAARLLRAPGIEARRDQFLALEARMPRMVDYPEFVDLRRPRQLLAFLSGATETRHFNEAGSRSGVFMKSSPDIAKMRAEYGFFHTVPDTMKRFLVPTFGFWENQGRAGYEMEHLPIPDAALQLVHQAFAPDEFEMLLDAFFAFLDSRHPGPDDARATLEAGRAHIIGKLDSRMQAFLQSEAGQKLDQVIRVSGPAGGLREMQSRAVPLIEAALKRQGSRRLVLGHGDPCFSNILFDRRLGLMRLIDPRGAQSVSEGMMHPLYDLAKFSHSVLGGYDFINNELFTCDIDRSLNLMLHLNGGGPPDWMQSAFHARLKTLGLDVRDVRAVELSLFLSMLPLHADHPRKLVGFTLVAAQILAELEAAP